MSKKAAGVFAITAYGKLKAVDVVFDTEGRPIDPLTKAPIKNLVKVCIDKQATGCIDKDFLEQAGELGDQSIWQYENSITFFFGPYSSYFEWLNSLAKLAGYPLTECERDGKKDMRYDAACWNGDLGSFSELIYLINRTGSIGSKTAIKLVQDFATHDDKAMEVSKSFYEIYWKWRTACDFAADGGMVEVRRCDAREIAVGDD